MRRKVSAMEPPAMSSVIRMYGSCFVHAPRNCRHQAHMQVSTFADVVIRRVWNRNCTWSVPRRLHLLPL